MSEQRYTLYGEEEREQLFVVVKSGVHGAFVIRKDGDIRHGDEPEWGAMPYLHACDKRDQLNERRA